MENRKALISGTGSYLPKKVLTNQDLEQIVETSDEWIVTRTGMKERRIADAEEFSSTMGVKAAEPALQMAQISVDQIDLILVATISPDYLAMSTASLIQHELGANNAAAIDIQAACSGYIYGLAMAKAFIESGTYRHILLIGAEKLSSYVNYEDRTTCVLFGDGAAACVISANPPQGGFSLESICLGSDGSQAHVGNIPAGGCRLPPSQETLDAKQHAIHMSGREVFKHAVRRMEASCNECLQAANVGREAVSWLVPHQANIRIIEAIAKRFELPMEKVYITLHKYGNTSASSIGIALDELIRNENVQKDDYLLLTAFGFGLSWGSALLRKS